MEKIAVFVGLDDHQDSVQVCVLDWGGKVLGNRTCENDPRRVAEYVATHGGCVERPWNPAKGRRTLRRD